VKLDRIAAGVDGFPEGRDAAALGMAIAKLTGAELMLVSVHSPALFPALAPLSWKYVHREAERALREARDRVAPGARLLAETDLSVARGLHRVVQSHHRDLLVVGSSRHAPEGHLRIGKRTRQLLGYFDGSLAVAPRGLAEKPDFSVRRIGVGFDGGPEATAALAAASSMAASGGVPLRICMAVDDRVPMLLRSAFDGLISAEWRDVIKKEMSRRHAELEALATQITADASTEVVPRRPADALLALSQDVDLLVIGSRRWGAAARVMLGSTGEALLQDAACPVLTVPRPVL
jgi:nucleotide-binding universal stress UspA family protein